MRFRRILKVFNRGGAVLAEMVGRVSPRAAGPVVSGLAAIRSRGFVPVAPAIIGSVVAPRRRILCREYELRGRMVLGKIFAANRYLVVVDPEYAHDASVGLPSPTGRFVVNGRRSRGSNKKSHVARVWGQVSGVTIALDPTRHQGPMVEKSDANSTHDGRVFEGPIVADAVVPGKVYQRLIDNSDGDEVIDLRITIQGNQIPFVYLKRRPLADRFSNTNSSVSIRETDAVFSVGEQEALKRFADAMGLDFGEADVLRDNASGTIWVVDATHGPAGPPNGLPREDARRAVARLAMAFDEMLESAGAHTNPAIF